ncbi:MAG: T9SS type A sorting domain-containing protein, partial [Sphingobacteriales bacterium]
MKKIFTLKLRVLVMLLAFGTAIQAQLISENFSTVGNTGGEDVNFPFPTQTAADQNIYFSCLVNVTDAAATKAGDYFLHLGNPAGTGISNFAPRVWVRITATGVNFAVTKTVTTVPAANWSADFAKNTTYLLVVRYKLAGPASADPVSLWVKQSGSLLETDPASSATTTETSTPSTVSAVALRQGNNGASVQLLVDAIKVGLTWASVTPATSSAPALTVSGSVNNLVTPEGTPSAPGSFAVSGANLTGFPGNLTASSASADIELSLNSGGPFTASVNIPYTAATLAATPVYARISGDATIGAVSSLVTVSGGGATSGTITVEGNVTAPQPTVQATAVSVSGITDNGLTINWTNGNGGSRIVVIRQTTAAGIAPVDATTYSANPAVTGSSSTGTGNFVVFNGSGTGPVTVTGLFAGTNYTIKVYEYDGGPTEENYLLDDAAGNPVTASTTGISSVIQQGYVTSVSTPLFAGRNTFRIPTVYIATVNGLVPNTTYRYYSQAVLATDFGSTISGVGSLILNDYTVSTPSFYNAGLGDLNDPLAHGKFTTNASGSFTGTFGFFASSNAKFNAGNELYPLLVIGEDVATSTIKYRFASNQAITMLNFAASGANSGSFIKGTSAATPNNVVALWRNQDGSRMATARPVSMTLVENNASTSAMDPLYDETDGSWNTIIPNDLSTGIQLIQQFNVNGSLAGCRTDADGTWGTTNTVNPGNGSATALQINSADAPLTALVDCESILPVRISSFAVQKQGNSTRLFWTTAQEINTKEFVVERSTDGGRIWTIVTTIPAAGNSNAPVNYNTTDFSPAKGINFYRLRMVDIDRKYTNSPQRSVLFGNADVVLVTPNPASSFANIYMGKTDNSLSQIIVTDMNGKQIERVRTSEQTYTLTTAKYGKGVYVVKVINETNIS